jgi:dTDP-4-amino-4,6-dideoxygalactose transaminase
MIPVTKAFLPPIEDYMAQVQRAYNNGWLTNRGELVQELEQKITEYLGLEESNILITNNGTIPLQIALKLLGKGGEIITTPFSYVATTAAIVWENCTPVFVDIHPEYLTIDETKIEAAITPRTTCILATHVFGNPCNVEAIEAIAKKHNLKVIYDAAHCFGVKYKGKSIFEYGDVSTCSFHATKIFHTGEGGAIFCKDADLFHKVFYSHNFGHKDTVSFHGLGINGKISELQAAMGLSVYPYLEAIFASRRLSMEIYDNALTGLPIQKIKLREGTEWNYSYYPIIFNDEAVLLQVVKSLHDAGVIPRRYFYPSLNILPYTLSQSMKVSEDVAIKILCLPIFFSIREDVILKVASVLTDQLKLFTWKKKSN